MLNETNQSKTADGTFSTKQAMRAAWVIWISLLTVPFLYTIVAAWICMRAEHPSLNDGMVWFGAAMIYLLATVPLSFFWRSHLFESYWRGEPVHPNKYLWGSIGCWLALELGGLFSISGCIFYKHLLPNLIPSLVAFVFFLVLYPSGRAMTRRTGSSEDHGLYEEPR